MFDKDWWNGNFEGNTLTYAEYGHRTQSGIDKRRKYIFSKKFGEKGEEEFKEISRSMTCTVLEVSSFEQEDGKRWYKLDLLYKNYYVFHAVAGDGFGEDGIQFGDELLLHKVAVLGKVRRRDE